MTSRTLVFPFLLAMLPAVAVAQERHLGPHVHGQASVDISVDAGTMEVQVSLPGHDAVGFEHPPGSPAESAAVDKATRVLHDAAWLLPAPAAGCTLTSATVSPHGFAGAVEPGGHADFDADYQFACRSIDKLDHINIQLASAFSSVQKVVVNLITAAGSNQQQLDGQDDRVDVQP